MKIYNQIYTPGKQDQYLKEIMKRKELMWGNGIYLEDQLWVEDSAHLLRNENKYLSWL